MATLAHGRHALIRVATRDDVDRLVAIENAAFATDQISRRSFLRQIASPTLALLVAVSEEVVHGYALVAFRRGTPHARIYSLAVDGTHGRGLGRLLMSACEQEALRRGCGLMRLEVNESNARAISIYERAGYEQIDRTADYYEDGAAALRYQKRLTPIAPDPLPTRGAKERL